MRSNKPKPSMQEEPKAAPGMGPNEVLQEEATEEEVKRGDYTQVIRLALDHTPED